MKKYTFLIFLFFSLTIRSEELKDFTLQVYGSKEKLNLTQLSRNSKVVLNFWASWCTACVQELEELETLKKNHPNIKFIAINAGEKKKHIKKFLRKHKFSYTILEDPDKSYSKSIGVLSLPQTIVLDKKRVIKYRGNTPPKDI